MTSGGVEECSVSSKETFLLAGSVKIEPMDKVNPKKNF